MKASALAGFGVALVLCATQPCRAQLLPPDASVAGLSQAELSARWWQWAVSFPDGANPVQETTGAFSSLGADQSTVEHPGIFFLAGAFTQDPVTRNATIGPDQFLFFPLTNVVSVIPFFGNTEAEIRQDAAEDLGVVSGLSLTLDGIPLASPTELLDFRQMSPPGLFDLVLPANNVFGLDPVTLQAVSDGIWVALEPLSPGSYQLRFTSQAVGTGRYAGEVFTQDITYNLTVVPEPSALALLALGLVALPALRRRCTV